MNADVLKNHTLDLLGQAVPRGPWDSVIPSLLKQPLLINLFLITSRANAMKIYSFFFFFLHKIVPPRPVCSISQEVVNCLPPKLMDICLRDFWRVLHFGATREALGISKLGHCKCWVHLWLLSFLPLSEPLSQGCLWLPYVNQLETCQWAFCTADLSSELECLGLNLGFLLQRRNWSLGELFQGARGAWSHQGNVGLRF